MRINRFLLAVMIVSMLLAACSDQRSNTIQGYIEGRYTYLATSVSGVLEKLLVARGDKVVKGQLLGNLEEKPEMDAYLGAVQNIKEVTAARDAIAADLNYAKLTYERYQILVPKKAIEPAQLDNAKSIYFSTLAKLAQANANIAVAQTTLDQAKWTLDQKKLFSPDDAIVFDTYYRIGEYTAARQAILSLLTPENIKAIFYVNEKYLSGIKLGNQVSVTCDRCKKNYIGKISFISPSAEYTPPIIYSRETNEKLVYRVEAAFNVQDASDLHPGQPIYVKLDLHE